MGYNIELVGKAGGYIDGADSYGTDLATTGGYGVVAGWLESLDAAKYPALAEFAANGTYTGTVVLGDQLADAYEESPPPESVRAIVERISDLLAEGDDGETVSITM